MNLRHGLRLLFRSPGVTVAALLAIALGIGANTAMFTVIHALLLRSLPFERADQIVMVYEHMRGSSTKLNVVSPANFRDWQARSQSFEAFGVFRGTRTNLTGRGAPRELQGVAVSPGFFEALRVQPRIGRSFLQSEHQPQAPRAVLISERLWHSVLGGDPGVLGKPITLSGEPATVIGVMPAEFQFLDSAADVWLPLGLDPARNYRVNSGRFLQTVARLKDGVSIESAQQELASIAASLEREHPAFNKGWTVNVIPLREQMIGDVKQPVLILMAAVGLVLLIACANVGNLLLARAAVRTREIAIRVSLGATRWVIVRQLLSEAVMLSLIGGVVGVLLAVWGVDALLKLAPRNLPGREEIKPDWVVFAFSLVLSVVNGIVFGMVPAWHASRRNVADSLKADSRTVAGGGARTRNTLVIAEVALSLMLLGGAGLLLRSMLSLQAIDPGVDTKNVVAYSVGLPNVQYATPEKRVEFFREATTRIRSLPGVADAGATAFLPGSRMIAATGYKVQGRAEAAPGQGPVTQATAVDPGFFRAARIRLIKGRYFEDRDNLPSAPLRFVVDESFARAAFPNEDAIGKQISVAMRAPNPYGEIIGVVADVRHTGLMQPVKPTAYFPHAHLPAGSMFVLVRGESRIPDAAAVIGTIQSLNADLPVAEVRAMQEVMAESISRVRFTSTLLVIFAVVALVLAVVGLFSVLAYVVTQRTREIGIRVALGAQRTEVIGLVLRRALLLTAAGIVVGLVGSAALNRFLATLLHGVKPSDPLTFAAVISLLLASAVLAALWPASRAARVDPAIALRNE